MFLFFDIVELTIEEEEERYRFWDRYFQVCELPYDNYHRRKFRCFAGKEVGTKMANLIMLRHSFKYRPIRKSTDIKSIGRSKLR